MNEKYIQSLRETIQQVQGCASRYAQSVAVKEEANGQTLWDGKVEVFDLARHPAARQCYAWGYKNDLGYWQYVTIARVPPVDSPRQAVQAFLASGGEKR